MGLLSVTPRRSLVGAPVCVFRRLERTSSGIRAALMVACQICGPFSFRCNPWSMKM